MSQELADLGIEVPELAERITPDELVDRQNRTEANPPSDEEQSTRAAEQDQSTDESTSTAEAESHQALADEVNDQASDEDKQDVVQEFIDQNYGGDKEAFVKSLYESRKHNSLLASEIKEMKAIVQSLFQPPDEDEIDDADQEPDPDVQLHEEYINGYNEELQDLFSRSQEVLQQISAVKEKLDGTKGALRYAEEDDARALKREAVDHEREIARLSGEWRAIQDKQKSTQRSIKAEELALKKAKNAADKARQQTRYERQRAKAVERQQADTWRNEATSNIASIVDGSKLIPADEKAEIKEQIRYRVANAIREQGPQENLGAFAKSIAAQHVRSLEKIARYKFSEGSRNKAAAAGHGSGNGRSNGQSTSSSSSTPKDPRFMTQKDWEDLAEKEAREAQRNLERLTRSRGRRAG